MGGNRRRRNNENEEPPSMGAQFLQILPILFFLLLSVVSSFSGVQQQRTTQTYQQQKQQQYKNYKNPQTTYQAPTRERVDTRQYSSASADDSFFCSSPTSTCNSPVTVVASELDYMQKVVNREDGYVYVVQFFDRDTAKPKKLKKSCRKWEKLANGLKGAAKVIAVDTSKSPKLKSHLPNKKLPPVLVFPPGKGTDGVQFNGEMQLSKLYPFIEPFVPQELSYVTSKTTNVANSMTLGNFLTSVKPHQGKVVIIDSELRSSKLYYKSVSTRLKNFLNFAQGRRSDQDLVKKVLVNPKQSKQFLMQTGDAFKPALAFQKAGTGKWIVYEGTLDYTNLCQWLVEKGGLGDSSRLC